MFRLCWWQFVTLSHRTSNFLGICLPEMPDAVLPISTRFASKPSSHSEMLHVVMFAGPIAIPCQRMSYGDLVGN